MANTVAKAAVYQTLLDEVINAGLTSAPLTANQSRIKYNGGNTVKIAKLSVDGFSDYSRSTGYPAGDAVLSWEDHVISMDRGMTFNVDSMDEDETGNTLSGANIIGEFGRSREVPEVDSYRYSAIFQAIVDDAIVRYGYYTPAAATLLTEFQGDVSDIQDNIGEQEPLVAFMSISAYKYLTTSTELSKYLVVRDGGSGINTKSYEIDGVQIVPVPSARMKTEYAFGTKGFTAKTWAQDINWIIMSQNAAVAFVKHQKVKVISADDNQDADAEKVMMRLYHDCWVYENKHNAIYVSLKTAAAPTIDALGGDVDNEADNMEITLGDAYTNRDEGHEFYYLDTNSATAPATPVVYDEIDLTSYTKITTADEVNVTVLTDDYGVVVAVDENSRVIGWTAIKVI